MQTDHQPVVTSPSSWNIIWLTCRAPINMWICTAVEIYGCQWAKKSYVCLYLMNVMSQYYQYVLKERYHRSKLILLLTLNVICQQRTLCLAGPTLSNLNICINNIVSAHLITQYMSLVKSLTLNKGCFDIWKNAWLELMPSWLYLIQNLLRYKLISKL